MLLGGRPVKWVLLRVVTINMGPILVECLLPQAILCTAGVPPAKKVHEGHHTACLLQYADITAGRPDCNEARMSRNTSLSE